MCTGPFLLLGVDLQNAFKKRIKYNVCLCLFPHTVCCTHERQQTADDIQDCEVMSNRIVNIMTQIMGRLNKVVLFVSPMSLRNVSFIAHNILHT